MIKHSKYKNTGVLFELLVRQTTADLMQNKNSDSIRIYKKYFNNTELGKEYKLYRALATTEPLNEAKGQLLINAVLDQAVKLNVEKLNKEKYNLIREIKKSYDLDDFFKSKVNDYRLYASIYTLFEIKRSTKPADVKQLTENQSTILEHITGKSLIESSNKSKIVDEFMKEDKEIRILAYKLLVEKFNAKYAVLSKEQKEILKEYINNITDTKQLKVYLNRKLNEIKQTLTELVAKQQDPVLKIKLNEVISLIAPIQVNQSIKDEHLISLLQYCELIADLKQL